MALNMNCNLLSHFWRSGGSSGTCSTASLTTLLLLLDVPGAAARDGPPVDVVSAATVAETPGIEGGRKLWLLEAVVVEAASLPLRNIIS